MCAHLLLRLLLVTVSLPMKGTVYQLLPPPPPQPAYLLIHTAVTVHRAAEKINTYLWIWKRSRHRLQQPRSTRALAAERRRDKRDKRRPFASTF